MRDILSIVTVGIVIWLGVTIFSLNKDTSWQGFYMQPSDNRIYTSEKFDTQESCRTWGEVYKNRGAYNVECGTKCKAPETINGIWVCDETFDI